MQLNYGTVQCESHGKCVIVYFSWEHLFDFYAAGADEKGDTHDSRQSL